MLELPVIVFKPKFITGYEIQYQTEQSGCFDLYYDGALEIELIPQTRYIFNTGTYLEDSPSKEMDLDPDFGVVLNLKPRSGLAAKNGIMVLAGEIDMDYRQEIKAILYNSGLECLVVKPGDRIVQARWTITARAVGVSVKNVIRSGGLGSTGK